jgi:hypothetical protein
MSRFKKYLTASGIAHVRQLAGSEKNVDIAAKFGVSERQYQNLTATTEAQASLSPNVIAKLTKIGFSESELQRFTSPLKQCKAVRKRKDNLSNPARQIAFRVLALLTTHQIVRGVDFEHDDLIKVYDSSHQLFLRIRELAGELPVPAPDETQESIRPFKLFESLLNDGIRPHLTIWQSRFRKWYEENRNQKEFRSLEPQQMQRRYPRYAELKTHLEQTSTRLQEFQAELERWVFEAE